ncbi:MAG: hypothetical protein M2R45_00828 [Verrucomicrobia subdivision 3 bacterium]|nr:hypothetical protein [Limisphaerales bacterium]MCS1413066.1 hypothetical protein [Limisphaerales bacterium]
MSNNNKIIAAVVVITALEIVTFMSIGLGDREQGNAQNPLNDLASPQNGPAAVVSEKGQETEPGWITSLFSNLSDEILAPILVEAELKYGEGVEIDWDETIADADAVFKLGIQDFESQGIDVTPSLFQGLDDFRNITLEKAMNEAQTFFQVFTRGSDIRNARREAEADRKIKETIASAEKRFKESRHWTKEERERRMIEKYGLEGYSKIKYEAAVNFRNLIAEHCPETLPIADSVLAKQGIFFTTEEESVEPNQAKNGAIVNPWDDPGFLEWLKSEPVPNDAPGPVINTIVNPE